MFKHNIYGPPVTRFTCTDEGVFDGPDFWPVCVEIEERENLTNLKCNVCRLSNGTVIVVPAAETTTKCAGETCSSSSSNNNVTTTNASTSIGNELREYCKIVI